MRTLVIPEPLKQEFATIATLWQSTDATRLVDTLALSWIKHEKQLRRLFCFLVFQHPAISNNSIQAVVASLAQNNSLYADTFVRGIKALGVLPVPDLVGARHAELAFELKRIKKYRNKIIHGQVTGQNITSHQLERDICHIIDWVAALAKGAESAFGYDGLRRNTFRAAKGNQVIAVDHFPFTSPGTFKDWLRAI